MKTGYTDAAMYCMAVTAKRNDMRLLAITLGEKEGKVRNKETSELLDYSFNLYKVETIKKKGEELGTISIDKANIPKIKIIANQDVTVLKNKKEKNSYIYLYHPSKDVVEWIERNNMFNLVEKDIQVIEKEEKYIKRKIRSCVYCNNDVSVSNHIWRY